MKILDTFDEQELVDLVNGDFFGVFVSAVGHGDVLYPYQKEMAQGYYLGRSGNKTVSLIYHRFNKIIEENELSDDTNFLLGQYIRSKFRDKWERLYSTLIESKYNPIENYEHKVTKSGTNTTEKTYGSILDDETKVSTKEITQNSGGVTDKYYGFNSSTAVPTNEDEDTSTITVTGNADENVTKFNQKKTGTDTEELTLGERHTITGRNESSASLINEELNMRQKQQLFDIVYADIDSVYALKIYC